MRKTYLLVAVVATLAIAGGVLGGVAGGQSTAPDRVCASATASTPDHVISQNGPTVDGAQLSGASYTIPGEVATAEQCTSIPPPVTETVTVAGSTTSPPATTTTPPATTTTAPIPARLVLFGSSTPPRAAHDTTSREAEARWLEQRMGRKLGITRHYVKAPTDWTGDGASTSIANGRRVMVTFTSGGDSWTQVANGSRDGYIKEQASGMKSRGLCNSYIAFENEPEAEVPGKGQAADYVRAFQHVMQVGNANGFCGHWTTALMGFTWTNPPNRAAPEAFIPKGIDTLGVHLYYTQVGSCGQSGVKSFAGWTAVPYATATKLGLRMGIWEMGYATAAGTDPAIKAAFFRSIPSAIETKFPKLDAITYWNQNGQKCDDAHSYYIDSSPEALQGWKDASAAAIFGG